MEEMQEQETAGGGAAEEEAQNEAEAAQIDTEGAQGVRPPKKPRNKASIISAREFPVRIGKAVAKCVEEIEDINKRSQMCCASVYIVVAMDIHEPGTILFRQAQLSVAGSPWIMDRMEQSEKDSSLARQLHNRINGHHMTKGAWKAA